MELYTVFWGKLSIVEEPSKINYPKDYLKYAVGHWDHLYTINDNGEREVAHGLISPKEFIKTYEFPDDESALLWFRLGAWMDQ